jgi:hypothetical protein
VCNFGLLIGDRAGNKYEAFIIVMPMIFPMLVVFFFRNILFLIKLYNSIFTINSHYCPGLLPDSSGGQYKLTDMLQIVF